MILLKEDQTRILKSGLDAATNEGSVAHLKISYLRSKTETNLRLQVIVACFNGYTFYVLLNFRIFAVAFSNDRARYVATLNPTIFPM